MKTMQKALQSSFATIIISPLIREDLDQQTKILQNTLEKRPETAIERTKYNPIANSLCERQRKAKEIQTMRNVYGTKQTN